MTDELEPVPVNVTPGREAEAPHGQPAEEARPLELHGSIAWGAAAPPVASCVWCGYPSDSYFEPAGHPELGLQPLHALCAAALIVASRAYLNGRRPMPVLKLGPPSG